MIFFCRLPVKRLKPRGGSLRFRAIILSGGGENAGDADERGGKGVIKAGMNEG